mgnify:CR=1 FL=1|jgi:hypothetical protein
MNIEYVIIPICIPDNDTDYLKVSSIPFGIWHHDDDTGRLIDTMQAEKEAINKIAKICGWTGKLDFVYGISTAGGIGDREAARKANERLIERLRQCTRIDYMRGKHIRSRY